MRRAAAAMLGAIALVGVWATPASAEVETVNAADNATRWDSRGASCNVAVDDFLEHEVNVYCFSSGRTWFKVRVEGVSGDVTRVTAGARGDCSGKTITFSKRGDVVTVKIANAGEFDCYYKRVTVRHSG